jgi:ACT domain-containing protein
MKKSIITVVGKDTVGITAKVCTYLAENNINILDISQTIVQGYFNMMMIVDMNEAKEEFREVSEESVKKSVLLSVARDLRFLKKCTDCKTANSSFHG